MAGNWVDTLKDRNAGLVPGFNPPDLPADVQERLARVDDAYLNVPEGEQPPATSPRDARAKALRAPVSTTAVVTDEPPAKPRKRTTAKKAAAAKKAR